MHTPKKSNKKKTQKKSRETQNRKQDNAYFVRKKKQKWKKKNVQLCCV